MTDPSPNDDPLRFAINVKTDAEYMRLPPAGHTDPIFALKRAFLNSLILPCHENAWRPPVKSIVLKRKGTRKGVRLIEIASLRAFIQAQVELQRPHAVPPASGGREHPQ
jgi:hypothetical protein